jgi:hypothetical protein
MDIASVIPAVQSVTNNNNALQTAKAKIIIDDQTD